MNRDLAIKLKDALIPTVQDYVWKTSAKKIVKMVDCTDAELKKFYQHSQEMLYNEDLKSPGKTLIKVKLNKLYDKINSELCLRYLVYDIQNDMINTNRKLIEYLQNMCKNHNVTMEDKLDTVFNALPIIYNDVLIKELFEACFDKLGVFNKKLISDKFILSLGIWLTPQELNEFLEYKNGKPRNRIEVIKERFNLEGNFKISPGGLTFGELKNLLNITGVMKITSIPTNTLKLLRDKVIILLLNENENSITQWETLSKQLLEVMEYKNIKL